MEIVKIVFKFFMFVAIVFA